MVRILNPILRLLGIGPSATTITIVGMTLGIAYGGGPDYPGGGIRAHGPARRPVLPLPQGLCHSVIEDTLLLRSSGSCFWILWGRIILSLIVVSCS